MGEIDRRGQQKNAVSVTLMALKHSKANLLKISKFVVLTTCSDA